MKRFFQTFAVASLFLLAACSGNLSSGTYSGGQVNTADKVLYGVITSKRTVHIDNSSGIGTLAGTVAGATAGSAIGGGTRANILGGVGGALAGGLLGSAVDKGINSQQGYEYIIRLSKGSTIAVTQSQDNNLAVGTNVMVIYGDKVRVVPTNQ
jgi:outer membrane lipoprotein SlyB